MLMYIFAEILLIITGIAGIIGSVTTFLGILISGRKTSTHFYIIYLAILTILAQFASPVFHHLFVNSIYDDFNVAEFLTLLFIVVEIHIFITLMFLFLVDYFRWITDYKVIVIIADIVVIILTTLIYYFVFHRSTHIHLIIGILMLVFLIFLFIFIVHRDVECLKKRKLTDDESTLRYTLTLTFISAKVIGFMIFLLENFMSIVIYSWPSFGMFALSFYQLDPVFFLIVLFKVDYKFKSSLLNLFKMCSIRRSNKVQFENLPSDNGRLLNQEV